VKIQTLAASADLTSEGKQEKREEHRGLDCRTRNHIVMPMIFPSVAAIGISAH
jgi:hypothetical protein